VPFELVSALTEIVAIATGRGIRDLERLRLRCLADVPVIISVGGLPVGRFMC
jgi:hypothetical protein